QGADAELEAIQRRGNQKAVAGEPRVVPPVVDRHGKDDRQAVGVDDPHFPAPVLQIQLPLTALVVTARRRRENLDDQLGRAKDTGFPYYVTSFLGNEKDVRLQHLVIGQDHVKGRQNYPPKAPLLDVGGYL